ncbi:hypothetical protein [Actinocorallia sp. A-T 12471]|uniref:hypothetical protein n=1 Tax=Actinocorallia sp. A-T 12471 TaxID=3089813 RepID=UPI0029D3C08E|nr:hypothetical protein [Actinocorallia sp. A-T 12471]MDX6742425.1 hypothetical protein [Actinocorallia sp. A-T 12471]
MRESRWAGGVSLVPDGAGWLVHTPAEEFLTVEAEPGTSVDLTSPELRDAFAAEGVVLAEPVKPGAVGLAGDGTAAAAVARLLAESGFAVLRGTEEELLGHGPVAVVSAADRLPDRRWSEVEPLIQAAGTPWHRIHAEGRRWYAGPFWTGPGTSGHGDTRIRRLAASPWPERLAQYWTWLDEGGTPEPDAAAALGAAVVAAFVVADLRALADGCTPTGTDFQVGVDLADGVVRRHPVLPVPRGLMRETPA